MLDKSFFVAFIFCLTSLVYIVMGFYILSLNIKRKSNQLFFLVTLSLSFWSGSYALITNSVFYDKAVLMSRLSVLGWGMYYALLLHFCMIISYDKESLGYKKALPIYAVPIFIISNVLFFNTSIYDFKLIKTDFGYTAITSCSFFNILINLYAYVYAILIFYIFYKWYKKIQDRKLRTNLKWVIYFSVLTFFIGVICDSIFLRILKLPAIQGLVIWLLMPSIAFFYLLLNNRILHPGIKININTIIDDNAKGILFRIFGYIYVILAYVGIVLNYLYKPKLDEHQIYITFLFIGIGFLHLIFTEVLKKEKSQYCFVTVLYMFMMGFMAIIHPNDFFKNFWLLFFSYLLLTTIFNKGIHSFLMFAFMIVTLALICLKMSHNIITIFSHDDFIIRILLMTMFFIIAYYINHSYKKRLKDNVNQIEKQLLLQEISKSVIEMNLSNKDSKICELLCDLSNGFDIKKSYYMKYKDDDEIRVEDVYFAKDKELHIENSLENTIYKYSDSLLKRLESGEVIKIMNIDIQSDFDDLKPIFAIKGINSLYAFPVFYKNKLRGISTFECIHNDENKLLNLHLKTFETLLMDAIKKIYAERELFFKAHYDSVTNLMKKDYFIETVNIKLKESDDIKKYCIYIDINDFKSINDTFGYSVGDKILSSIAIKLKELGDNKNIVTRFTNDEFAIFFFDNLEDRTIENYLKNITNEFKRGIKINENNFILNVNIGISEYPKDGYEIETLLKNADLAMHKAKKLCYMNYHFCNDEDKRQVVENAMYKDKLYTALENGEFYIVYQPQVDIETEKIKGVEALLRWETKDFGVVSPNKFIPILESTGLIKPVAEWLIEECIKQHIKLEREGICGLRISINLSAVQFMDDSLVDTIETLKQKYGINSHNIEFEITESVAINDSEFVIDSLNKIKKMGFSISIDDFGTGFSSLNRLQKLPIDCLKIDKSFIDGIGKNKKMEAVINVIIELAKNLGIRSIAEGVELEEQLQFLEKFKCCEIQGYYYAKPMVINDLRNYIWNNKKQKR